MSDFLRIIFVNVRRHRLRAVISVAGIAFGVAAMLTIVSIVLGAVSMFQDILSSESHYIVFEKDVSDLFFSSVVGEEVEALRKLPNVAEVDPMLVGIVSSPGHPIITCFGVEAGDARLRKARWIGGSASGFDSEKETVYIGVRAAEFLKAAPGDRVPIGKATFRVGGIFRTGNGFEDGGVFMPLPLAQVFFHRPDVVSLATVRLKETDDGKAFQKEVSHIFPGLVALEDREFNRNYSQFKILTMTSWTVGLFSFLLGGMGVANTMLMSVFARIREIAVLRVCGFSKIQVAGIVLGEAALLSVVGTALGFAIGLSGLAVMGAVPQLQGYVQADVRPSILGLIGLVAFLTAVGGALYPAWFASRIEPASALRFE